MSVIAMYFVLLKALLLPLLACLIVCACNDDIKNTPDKSLKIVIIRHAEKPIEKLADKLSEKSGNKAISGDNLSCQGQNRALQLPAVLIKKIGKPDYTYVPALSMDKNTAHSRMFQTVTPFAVKYDLTINTKFAANDYADAANNVLKKSGTVLLVWSHSEIADLANALGVDDAPKWRGDDYDSMWIVSYVNGKAELVVDHEGLNPSANCGF